MLLHLGRGVSIHSDEIIALCDLSEAPGDDTRRLADTLRAAGRVRYLGDAPKTMILCDDPQGGVRCLYSCVGLRTFMRRATAGVSRGSCPEAQPAITIP